MPTFPNGSSVWLGRFNDKPDFEEYGESVEEKDGTYTISCFIAAEKEEEWRVGYALALEGGSCMRLEVDVDCQRVTAISISEGECGYEKHLNGWQLSAWRLQRFRFGEIETEETDEAWDIGHRKELHGSCIEVTFYGATVTGRTNLPAALQHEPQVAAAIHPDSKAATLVGIQCKPGSTEIAGPLIDHAEVTGAQAGATRYVARFAYRPAKLLIAQELMPEKAAVESAAAGGRGGDEERERREEEQRQEQERRQTDEQRQERQRRQEEQQRQEQQRQEAQQRQEQQRREAQQRQDEDAALARALADVEEEQRRDEQENGEEADLARALAASKAHARAEEARKALAVAAAEAEARAQEIQQERAEARVERAKRRAEAAEEVKQKSKMEAERDAGAIERAVPKPEPDAEQELQGAAAGPSDPGLSDDIRAKEEPYAASPGCEQEEVAADPPEPIVAPKREPRDDHRESKRQRLWVDLTGEF